MYRLVRPLLFLLPPEAAHRLAATSVRLFPRARPGRDDSLEQTVLGLRFPNPLGLAAGMDKGDVLAPGWFSMGFGWIEIGTVTPLPQPGNPRPRLFRLVQHRAVINRMGFNNPGAGKVARRLQRLRRQPGPICLNVGRNKATPNERAAQDYANAAREVAAFADLVTINVSSPNTPGLRALQDELGSLVAAVRAALPVPRPVLVKLSPDEPDEKLVEMAKAAVEAGASGIVATNTTLSRSAVRGHPRAAEQGGLSGAPLRSRADEVCKLLYRSVRVPIVGVGGIFTPEDAYRRIRAGATLLQLYTGLIYEGPGLPRRIVGGLSALLRRDGLELAQAIGADARP